jgi:hypothetical protein
MIFMGERASGMTYDPGAGCAGRLESVETLTDAGVDFNPRRFQKVTPIQGFSG